jgi:hypothetical protein
MKPNKFALPFLLTAFCLSGWAGSFNFLKVNDQRRVDVRDSVYAQRSTTGTDVKRNEVAGGRRLTAAELAELRQQVRQQWSPRQEIANSTESQPAERIVPAPATKGAALDSPGRPRR